MPAITRRSLPLLVAALLATATVTPAKADPVGGPKFTSSRVEANSTDSYVVRLWGDEPTQIILRGDGDTCLELRIYDENGNLVASDTLGLGDRRSVTITPRNTGKFTVKVKNLGSIWNQYKMFVE